MIGLFKNYIEKRISLIKLETAENTVRVLSMLVYLFVIVSLAICFFAFFCLGLGLIIGKILENYAYGMLIVAAVFLLSLLLVILLKKNIIQALKGSLVNIIFNEE